MMPKDKTIFISIAIVAVNLFLTVVKIIPKQTNGSWFYGILHLIFFIAACRIFVVLPIQTLIHAVKYEPEDKRVKWVIAHLLVFPFAGLPYYYTTKKY